MIKHTLFKDCCLNTQAHMYEYTHTHTHTDFLLISLFTQENHNQIWFKYSFLHTQVNIYVASTFLMPDWIYSDICKLFFEFSSQSSPNYEGYW